MSDDFGGMLIRYGGDFAPFVVDRADGSWVQTEDGQRILDFTSGQMCATLGHGHPAILEAIGRASGSPGSGPPTGGSTSPSSTWRLRSTGGKSTPTAVGRQPWERTRRSCSLPTRRP